jgi:poly(3-hydroxybutyrate) depolymerase
MYKLFTGELCVDTSRVFATGFSFGAMMTYSLSLSHQKQLRAVVALAAANFNIYDPPDTKEPIAYMGTVGMSDTTCPYVHSDANQQGGKYCALTHATDNGCTPPASIPTTTVGSKTHVCYDFVGCKAGYPVKMCTFDGVHQAAPYDGGSGDHGLTSWIPPEAWKFFTHF